MQTFSIVSPWHPEGLQQRTEIMRIAKGIGLRMISGSGFYRPGAEDIERALGPALATMQYVLALPNLAPKMRFDAREMGSTGPITTEAAHESDFLVNAIGAEADGLVMLGGASPIDSRRQMRHAICGRTAAEPRSRQIRKPHSPAYADRGFLHG